MKNQEAKILGLSMPDNFPANGYDLIHTRIIKKEGEFPEAIARFRGGWHAVAYRFVACSDHNKNFTFSVQKFGPGPQQPERCVQEKELFNFFVTGLSVIESFCFALFNIASIVDSEKFPILPEEDLKHIDPYSTKDKLISSKAFCNEPITNTLKMVLDSQDYNDWREVRNILAHRIAAGRHHVLFAGGGPSRASWIKGIQINGSTTSSRFEWLAKNINKLINDLDLLTSQLF